MRSQGTSAKTHHSEFGGLWIDEIGAETRIEERHQLGELSDTDYRNLQKFWADGYVILENAVPHSVVDAILADAEKLKHDPYKYITRNNALGYGYATSKLRDREDFRVLDFHVNSPAARDAMFAEPIAHFLYLIFERAVLAFQTLYFKYGSQQAMHQDTAYVVSSSPLELAASWIALEDVEEGSGELIYFRGSHRLPDYKFSGEHKSFLEARDGAEQHRGFLDSLYRESAARGFNQESFLPKKGDALIWSADLAHGGAKLARPGRTRKSLVTHYCPDGVNPNYFTFTDLTTKIEHRPLCLYSSRHYDLRQSRQPRSPVFVGNRKHFQSATGQKLDFIPRNGAAVQVTPQGIQIQSKSGGSGLLVEQVGGLPSQSPRFSVEIDVGAASNLTVRYSSTGEPAMSLKNEQIFPLQRGLNRLDVRVPSTDIDERVAFEFGAAGKVTIRDISILPE